MRSDRRGFETFLLMWLAQVVSVAGSGLTGFSLGVWAYQRSGAVTVYGLIAMATMLPMLLAGPAAGVLADRWDRRHILIAGHAGAGACSLVLALLVHIDAADVWVLVVMLAVASAFNAAQLPVLSASMTLLVAPNQLGRANGLLSLGFALAQIAAPVTAGVLLPVIQLTGILAVDVVTFIFAIGVLTMIAIPQPEARVQDGSRRTRRMVGDLLVGWRYIRSRPGLLGLLLFLAVVNFNFGMVQVLIAPLVLGFSDAVTLGTVFSCGGVGMLLGSVLMVLWGGPRRPIKGVLGFALLQGLVMLLGAAQPSAPLAAVGAFFVLFSVPLVTACNQTIWQRQVPPSLQGRVFSTRAAIAGASLPVAFILAGPAADAFEPMMLDGGLLASSAGRLLGTGPGRGAALLFVALGTLTVASVIAGYCHPRLRRVQDEIPVDSGVEGNGTCRGSATGRVA